jgi:hypothetical protein
MTTSNEQILATSQDRRELLKAAMQLARSKDPVDTDTLSRYLTSGPFLGRLDTPPDYANAAKRQLHISRVVHTLSQNPASDAKLLIVKLLEDKTYMAEPDRVDAALRASASVRPPPPELVRFWRGCLDPNEPYTYVLTAVLLQNGTAPALGIFGEYLNHVGYESEDKRFILYTDLLPYRYNITVVEFADRALRGAIPQDLRVPMVEALFDYRPAEWYLVHAAVDEPDISTASPAALSQLRRVGEFVLKNVQMSDQLRDRVQHAVTDLAKRAP